MFNSKNKPAFRQSLTHAGIGAVMDNHISFVNRYVQAVKVLFLQIHLYCVDKFRKKPLVPQGQKTQWGPPAERFRSGCEKFC